MDVNILLVKEVDLKRIKKNLSVRPKFCTTVNVIRKKYKVRAWTCFSGGSLQLCNPERLM